MEPPTDRVFGHTPKAATSYQAVAEHLQREIALGNIVAGEKLPAERVLSEQLGVARETLRQALRVLEGSGLIEVRRGASGGAFVLPKTGSVSSALVELRERRDDVLQTLEFRGIVESHAAALAAERRDASHLEELEALQEQLLLARTLDEARRADTAFHAVVARASRNELLEQSIEDARVLMFGITDQTLFEFRTRASHHGHQQVLDAIRDGDAERAAESMRAHILTTVDEFEHLIHSDLA